MRIVIDLQLTGDPDRIARDGGEELLRVAELARVASGHALTTLVEADARAVAARAWLAHAAPGVPVFGRTRSNVDVSEGTDARIDVTLQQAALWALDPDVVWAPRTQTASRPRVPLAPWLPVVDTPPGQCDGRTLLAALEAASREVNPRRGSPLPSASARRPRLALVTPLPPERTGVAAYVAQLLSFLACWYQVTLVSDQSALDDDLRALGLPLRSHAWFDRNAAQFDRVLYQMGNARFHAGMLALMRCHPGVAVLHDLVLSDLLEHLERSGEALFAFTRAAYRSHGWPALRLAARDGVPAAVRATLCSAEVFDAAHGVILHSHYAAQRAQAAFGPGLASTVVQMPAVRPAVADMAAVRRAARVRLGLAPEAFLICSFGVLAPSKLNHRLLAAWQASPLATDPACRLVFVGEAADANYAATLQSAAAAAQADGAQPLEVTGHVDDPAYADWLAAADLAVQLRTDTRGETSKTVLDCLASGLPVIVNAHGPVAELPADAVLMLEDHFADADLAHALQRLHADSAERQRLADAGLRFVRAHCDPAAVCAAQVAAIEAFHLRGPKARAAVVAEEISRHLDGVDDVARLLPTIAQTLADNDPGSGPRQLLLDVTALALHDLRSGIQRLVRAVLNVLLDRAPAGWRVEPVYLDQGRYRYARRFTGGLLGVPAGAFEDEVVDARWGDVFLGLDLVTHGVHLAEPLFAQWRARGVSVQFVVYDLLPVQRPDWFPEEDAGHYRRWLETVLRVSDRLLCISQATADAVREQLHNATDSARIVDPAVAWFHLGADLPASLPSQGLDDTERALLARLAERRSLVMVGTVEPRKGHRQALDAFETLWRAGFDAELIIVGRAGWMVEDLVARLRAHPEAGRRLHWLERASDELLTRLYASCSGLLMASEGEGFGLPLIEAAQHGLPILARKLPVFREVAGEHAAWFEAADGAALAAAIRGWFDALARGAAPASSGMPWRTWQQSTQALVQEVLGAATSSPHTAKTGPAGVGH